MRFLLQHILHLIIEQLLTALLSPFAAMLSLSAAWQASVIALLVTLIATFGAAVICKCIQRLAAWISRKGPR